MRLRKKNWSVEIFQKYNKLVYTNSFPKGQWREILKSDKIHLEIGAGKGDYWHKLALQFPNRAIIALEKDYTAASIALKKLNNYPIEHKALIHGDANQLESMFDKGEVDVINLNFSDPWPKKRHHKRRLTYPSKLEQYWELLENDGEIWFKTDNRQLFNDSLLYFDQSKFKMVEVDVDFRSEVQNDPMTEYEKKFVELDQAIYRGVWKKDVK